MLIAGLINIVNLIGNSLFIFVFKWGVGGAALSFRAVARHGGCRLSRFCC